MNILRYILGVDWKSDVGKYKEPRIISETRDACGDVVSQTVRADNHHDATRHLNGVTIQGNRTIVATRTSARTWIIHIENWGGK